ncbi:MAG: SH3 domain-containing protein [Eubacteriales bacterium]|nr:SH3 domain-containing protein [Eubacteriales bacterium]
MDNFREWLSDNLRYFMLGGVVLIIVVVLVFGVRACIGNKKGNSNEVQNTEADDNQGNVPSSPANKGETDEKKENANPMEESNADSDISALIKSYYKALGGKDIATLKTLVDDLAPTDESKITNAKDYIEGYEVVNVYTKKGLTEDTYVVYARFDYICKGITTKAPALSWFYVVKDSEGNWKIDGGAVQDAEISAYVTEQQSDEDVKQLYLDTKQLYDQAQEDDPALAEFLAGLGEDASASVTVNDGTMLTVTEDCNVRAEADGEAEVIGGLAAGTQVEKKGVEGEWIQIDYEGQTAYVHSSLLE